MIDVCWEKRYVRCHLWTWPLRQEWSQPREVVSLLWNFILIKLLIDHLQNPSAGATVCAVGSLALYREPSTCPLPCSWALQSRQAAWKSSWQHITRIIKLFVPFDLPVTLLGSRPEKKFQKWQKPMCKDVYCRIIQPTRHTGHLSVGEWWVIYGTLNGLNIIFLLLWFSGLWRSKKNVWYIK